VASAAAQLAMAAALTIALTALSLRIDVTGLDVSR
jgi:hypothetical protein